MSKKKSIIFLIGFMAAGKSTLAKKIARSLSFQFIDTDKYIESITGLSISEFIRSSGIDAFRMEEHKALNEIIKMDNSVVATGGGLPCFYNNMDIIKGNGFSIYIKYAPGIIFHRIKNAHTERPLVKGMNDDEMIKFIENTLIEREPFYNKANCVLNKKNVKTEDLLMPILEYLENNIQTHGNI